MNTESVLIVIDPQKSFCTPITQPTVPKIAQFIINWQKAHKPIVFTRFVNCPNSPYETLLRWQKCQESSDEVAFIEEIIPLVQTHFVVTKQLYSAFTSDEFVRLLTEKGWKTLVLCGFSTHACVMKTALDAFERGFRPVILTDLCGSHNGVNLHESALTILPSLIGKSQVQTSESFNLTT